MTDQALKPLFTSRLPYFILLQLSARFSESLPQLVQEADEVGFVNCAQTMHPVMGYRGFRTGSCEPVLEMRG